MIGGVRHHAVGACERCVKVKIAPERVRRRRQPPYAPLVRLSLARHPEIHAGRRLTGLGAEFTVSGIGKIGQERRGLIRTGSRQRLERASVESADLGRHLVEGVLMAMSEFVAAVRTPRRLLDGLSSIVSRKDATLGLLAA